MNEYSQLREMIFIHQLMLGMITANFGALLAIFWKFVTLEKRLAVISAILKSKGIINGS